MKNSSAQPSSSISFLKDRFSEIGSLIFKHQGALIVDQNGRITEANEFIKKLCHNNSLEGKNLWALMSQKGDSKKKVKSEWEKILAEELLETEAWIDNSSKTHYSNINFQPYYGKTTDEKFFLVIINLIDKFIEREKEIQSHLEEIKTQKERLDDNLRRLEFQKKQADEERTKNKATLDGCVDAVITINKENIVEYWNPAAEKLTGYSSEEMMGKDMRIIAPPQQRQVHSNGMQHHLKTGERTVLNKGREIEILHKNGHKVPVLLTLSKATFKGEPIFTAFIKDISSLIEEREKNETIKKRNEAILNGCVDSVITIDTSNIVEFWNPAAEKLTGYKSEEMIGKDMTLIIPKEEREGHIRGMEHYMRTREKRVIGKGREVNIQKKNGEIVPALLTLSETNIGGKQIFTAFIKDLSDDVRKRKELEAKEELEKLVIDMKEKEIENRALLTAVNQANAYVEFDLDHNILTCNDNFLHAVGYTREELIGANHSMLVDSEYAKSDEYIAFWNKLESGETLKGDFERVSKYGSIVYLKASYSPVYDENGKIIKFIKVALENTALIKTFKEASTSINQILEGNFNYEMDLDNVSLTTELQIVVEDINRLKSTIKTITADVNQVVKLAGEEGELESQINPKDTKGAWKELINSINKLLQNITRPVFEVTYSLSRLAEGDLTHEISSDAKGELAKMSSALNKAVQGIRALMLSVESNGMSISSAADDLGSRSEQMSRSTAEMASATRQMSEGAQQQAQKIDNTSRLAEQILQSARSSEKSAQSVKENADLEQDLCNKGIDSIEKLVKTMNTVSESSKTTTENITNLKDRSEDISRALSVITEIAAQTNLLALNAAIEAARAGDAGRGFAVVADEIRKLAEDSKRSATDIDKTVKAVKKDVDKATNNMEQMGSLIKESNNSTFQVQMSFEKIRNSSSETLSLSKNSLDLAKNQEKHMQDIVKIIEEIVVISEETAAGTEQIAASTEELNKNMDDITGTGALLNDISDEFRNGLSKFTLRKA
ncbi:MAG: PAS domain S-box protein [Cyclobacteriaceae bacterium]|nr:PAS domain S-box protein [Cyclobacteriaceae bacterium]MCH8517444.1 PAS domain S-box protein [Cyclobacteriaceae bacterium]